MVLAALMLPGCLSQAPATPSYRTQPWDNRYPQSRKITTPHYEIYTDIHEQQSIDQLTLVMEASYAQYSKLSPPLPPDNRPLRCYIFSRRDEWASFTSRNTGADSAIYLQINRGAYTVDDWFVAYWIGDHGTLSIAAHEGWHQFVARRYISRMPPALDEGLACAFENLRLDARDITWSFADNPARCEALRAALAANRLWLLKDLLRLHAGNVISLSRAQIDTFYAQAWAMALFLMRPESPYRAGMDRYFADLAAGCAFRPAQFAKLKSNEWHPALSEVQLAHYLGKPLVEIEAEYRLFCIELSRE